MLQTLTKVAEIQKILDKERDNNRTVGFVPTMGALHQGHLSLIESARSGNDITVCSIFVNPTQFNDKSDYGRYPRTTEEDTRLLGEAGCDYLFLPTVEDIYPEESFKKINFDPGKTGQVLEGSHRPGHFAGVAAVVKRLFDIVQPDRAYFGQKDYQQCLIIRKMVNDFTIPVELIFCPTLREKDGLAMSSRNMLLSPEERVQAPFLYQMLLKAREMVLSGSLTKEEILSGIEADFSANGNFKVDYFDICSADDLQPVQVLSGNLIVCVAAFLGNVRLIDNLLITDADRSS